MQAENIIPLFIPSPLPEELTDILLKNQHLRLERIISKGHTSPEDFWYDQPENEWVLVLQGEALLELEGEAEPVRLAQGSYINLPAHVRHRVAWTSQETETIWLALFY
jgi:cupin 2 domain-containing protein